MQMDASIISVDVVSINIDMFSSVDKKVIYLLGFFLLNLHSILYYKNVGEVRCVRLVVNREGEHVGCAFVEVAFAEEAKKALLHESRAHIILSDVVEMAPYPIRPKYNLAETLWNEEYLEPLSLPIEEDYLEKQEVTKVFCGKKKPSLKMTDRRR